MLGIRGGVAVEPERVHLEDGGTLGANVLDGGAADAHGVLDVLAAGEDAGDAVVLTLVENLLVGGDVLGEGVDGAAVVDDDEEDGEVLLGGGVEALGHPPVLRAALAHEHHRDAILRLPRAQVLVQRDGPRGAHGVRQLLGDERPPALEVGLHVVDVHAPARAAARAAVATEEPRHDGARATPHASAWQ